MNQCDECFEVTDDLEMCGLRLSGTGTEKVICEDMLCPVCRA